jgi:hypothetical protein
VTTKAIENSAVFFIVLFLIVSSSVSAAFASRKVFSYFWLLKGKWILTFLQARTSRSVTYPEVTIVDNQHNSHEKEIR